MGYKFFLGQAPVAQAYNPSYLGDKDQKDHGSRPAWVKSEILSQKCPTRVRHRWLMPVILATQEAAIRRIVVQSQPRKILCETLSHKNTSQKRTGGVAQGVVPELKPQYH
jgi:hypothetical protein